MSLHSRLTYGALLLPLAIQATEPKISLQWAICDNDAATVLAKLDYDPDKPPYKENPIVYYDAWPPHYTRDGVAFRTKVKKHDPGYPISMIKARFEEFNEDVPSAASCVWDRYGDDLTYTCGLAFNLSDAGGAEGKDVWSPEQVDFAEMYQPVEWKELVPFGPYTNPKWKVHVLGMKAVFDDVRALPLHLMEIEVGVKQKGAEKVYEDVTRFLVERGVVLCEKQLPKTLRLFDFLVDEAAKGRDINGSGQIVVGQ